MTQTDRAYGQSAALIEAAAGDLTTTQEIATPWLHTRWTIGVVFVDSNGDVSDEGDLPTAGGLTFEIKYRCTRQWEATTSGTVDLANGVGSVTVAGAVEAVRVRVTSTISGHGATVSAMRLTAIGVREGGV